MSAKLCREESCGKLVVFAKDIDTDKWQVLSNQLPVWRIVSVKNGVSYVVRDPKALVSHFVNCSNPNRFSKSSKEPAAPERHFSEPQNES